MEKIQDSRQPCLPVGTTHPRLGRTLLGFCDRKHGTTDGCDTVHNEFILINDLRPALRLLLEVYLIGVSEIDMGIISGLRSGQFGFRSSNMALPNKPIWENCPYINQ
jgi:hypothetical protein